MKAFALTLAGFLFPLSGLPADQAVPSKARVVDLRVERMTNPGAVNHPLPRFGWRIETEAPGYIQTSYRILAASTPELLAEDKGDLWDSEEKPGRKTQFISFGGTPLTSGQVVHWKVKSKNRTGQFTPWSEPAEFTVRLSGPPELPSPLFLPVSESPRLSSFECSDPNLNKIYELAAERLHEITSVRDIGLVTRAASYHQQVHPRASAWIHRMNAAVDVAGFYPATLPSDGSFGATQSDAAITATHAFWWMTGDTDIVQRHLPTMLGYIERRTKLDPTFSGNVFGQLPQDTISPTDPTPPDYIDLTAQAFNIRLLIEMGRVAATSPYQLHGVQMIPGLMKPQFKKNHFNRDGGLRYESTVARLMALRCGLLGSGNETNQLVQTLADTADPEALGKPFASQNLLPVLSWSGHHDEALSLASSLNRDKLSPVTLAGISDWLISVLAGISAGEAGFGTIKISPAISNKGQISFVRAEYQSVVGPITIAWERLENGLSVTLSTPPNTISNISLPLENTQMILKDGKSLSDSPSFANIKHSDSSVSFLAMSGDYEFLITGSQ